MNGVRRAVLLLSLSSCCLLWNSCGGFFLSNSDILTVTVSPAANSVSNGACAVILAAGASPVDSIDLVLTSTTVGGTTATNTANATWSSSNTSVATVSAGVVTAASAATGNQTATITAKYGGQSGTCNVLTYTGTEPSSLSVNSSVTSPQVSQVFAVTAQASLNNNSSSNLTSYVLWSSNATSLATVDANGNVTVSSSATVGAQFTITATAVFSNGSITGTRTYTVL